MGCFSGRLMSSASDQKLFCKLCSPFCCSFDEFVEEKVISPSYSSAILTPPPRFRFLSLLLKEGPGLFLSLEVASSPGTGIYGKLSNFLEEISNHSHCIVFLYFFAFMTEEVFLISPCYSLELCIQMVISFHFSFTFSARK